MVPKIPRVVNDTNVWLSALYFSGKPAKIVNLIEDQKIVSLISDFILEEVKEKLVSDFDTPLYAANGTVSYISSIIVQEYHGFLPVGELNNYVLAEGVA
ncbi:putative toxin-antitoxin system toxin component, PIN family [Candidatus Curtissbacteria bacterium]|nr:putative toxin-antitoxin system toxin component, PIN family [Candidatus Curtissbacteria bacterium]